VAPWSGFAVAQSRPRWLSMIERLIERPMIRPLAGGLSSWRAHGFPVQPLVAASRARTWPDWTRFAPKLDLQCTVLFHLILPARAHRLLAEAAGQVLLALRDLLNLLLQDLPRTPDRTAVAATHLRLSRALSGVEGLVDEVRRERNNRLTDAPDPEPAARTLRRLRHDLTAVGRAVTESLPHPACLYLEEATGGLRRGISDYL
jgi:hypothetical protein